MKPKYKRLLIAIAIVAIYLFLRNNEIDLILTGK